MAKLTILLCLFAASMVLAKPVNDEALDKATANDVVVNSVNPEQQKPVVVVAEEAKNTDPGKSHITSEVFLSDVSFGTPAANGNKRTPGSAVARIIDDIFQIPIGVLQSVARLLRNPFVSHTHKTPETTTSY
ncbi:hypothetical protein ILUMI_11840 [Ignelater luminosus]|uniref:Uncharacterized protein n=1 Tax=Ignelater luminosus TaxID=2038154 RepID=A0A8K0CZS2_IGNLU|nr:hypothetical protein ILUMI_11840 [Ignelater luminosus]